MGVILFDVNSLWYKMVIFLIVALVFFSLVLFAVRYYSVIRMVSNIDAMNDTISSYIQKNGGWVPRESSGVKDLDKFKQDLVEFYSLEDYIEDINYISITKNHDQQEGTSHGNLEKAWRGTTYTISTKFRVKTPSLFYLLGGFKREKWLGYDRTKPRVTTAYVSEYRNYD